MENKEDQNNIEKSETLNIEIDRKNARISFVDNNQVMLITIPLAFMTRPLVLGFLVDAMDIVKSWYAEQHNIQMKLKEQASRFSFKSGLNKLLRR